MKKVLDRLIGLGTQRPRATLVVAALVAAVCAAIALGLQPNSGINTLVSSSSADYQTTQQDSTEFGGAAVVVLVRENLKDVLGGRDLATLANLEACLGGSELAVSSANLAYLPVAANKAKPYGGSASPCGYLMRDKPAQVVYGPGTFLDQAVTAIDKVIAQLLAAKDYSALETLAEESGINLSSLTTLSSLTSLSSVLPSLANTSFLDEVVFNSGTATPKSRFSYIFPTASSMLIQVRLRPNLNTAQTSEAIREIRAAVKMPLFKLGSGGTYLVSGEPVVLNDLSATLSGQVALLLVGAVIVMGIVLLLVFRRRLRLLPLALALASAAVTFGLCALAGGSLTMASIAVLPILIGLAVDYGIQFQSRASSATTILAAALATGTGFLVLLLSPVPMVQGFGLLLVIGVGVAFVIVMCVGSAALIVGTPEEDRSLPLPSLPGLPALARVLASLPPFRRRGATRRSGSPTEGRHVSRLPGAGPLLASVRGAVEILVDLATASARGAREIVADLGGVLPRGVPRGRWGRRGSAAGPGRAGSGAVGRLAAASAGRFDLDRGLRRVSARPRTVLAVGLVLALAGWVLDTQTPIQSDITKLVPSNLPALTNLNTLERVSGTSGEVDVLVHAPDVATQSTMRWMIGYESAIVKHFGYVEKTGCAAATVCPALSLPDLFAGDGDADTADPTQAQINSLLATLPGYFSQAVLSSDRRYAALAFGIRLMPLAEQVKVIAYMRAHLDPPPGVTAEMAGLPVLAADADGSLSSASRRLLTLLAGLIAVGLVLTVIFRNRRRALIPLAPIVLATGWSALIVWLIGIPLNPMSATLGALVIAISTEFSVLLSERYRRERLGGSDNPSALAAAYRTTGLAVLCSGITAIAGFGVLIVSDVTMLRDFGLVTLIDMSVSLLGVLAVLPAVLALTEQPIRLRDPSSESEKVVV